jgi:hypothetical protein
MTTATAVTNNVYLVFRLISPPPCWLRRFRPLLGGRWNPWPVFRARPNDPKKPKEQEVASKKA